MSRAVSSAWLGAPIPPAARRGRLAEPPRTVVATRLGAIEVACKSFADGCELTRCDEVRAGRRATSSFKLRALASSQAGIRECKQVKVQSGKVSTVEAIRGIMSSLAVTTRERGESSAKAKGESDDYAHAPERTAMPRGERDSATLPSAFL